MVNVFLIADTHFGHKNICTFKNYDGTKVRPWDDVNEMDEEMVKRWNETVSTNDKVYLLGDAVINRKSLSTFERLKGDKVLIKGNHDIFRLEEYTKYFRDIRAYHVLNGCILSHIPVSLDSIARFGCNIHGHLHGNRVRKITGYDAVTNQVTYSDDIDPNYFCVSVEHTDFRPIALEEVYEKIRQQGGNVGFRNGNQRVM